MLAQDRDYTHCLWGLALCVSSAAGPALSGLPFWPFAIRPCAPRTACSRNESFLGRSRRLTALRRPSAKVCAKASLPHSKRPIAPAASMAASSSLNRSTTATSPRRRSSRPTMPSKKTRFLPLSARSGTPTSKAGQPIATAAKVPFIGPFTGAEFLRNPFNRYIVNIRSSYFQETESWIEHLTNDLGITRIAILYQDDAFGLAGLAGVKKAMAKRDMSLVAEGTFKRNTTAVKSAMLEIMKGQPQAVLTVGPYKPIAEFIKLARQLRFDPVFVAISFVGSDSLAHELGNQGGGVVVSQVVPFPADRSLPAVLSYQTALTAINPNAKPGIVYLQGYLVGRLVVEALKRIPGDVSREAFLDAVAGDPFDLGGVKLSFSATQNQGSNQVYFTVLQADGSFRPVTKLVKTVAR